MEHMDVRPLREPIKRTEPPCSRRPRMFKDPRDTVPLEDSYDPERCLHALVPDTHGLYHVSRAVFHRRRPRIRAGPAREAVDAAEGTARGREHRRQDLCLRGLLLDMPEHAGPRQIKVLAMEAFPFTGLKALATDRSRYPAAP